MFQKFGTLIVLFSNGLCLVHLLPGVKQIKGCPLRDKEDGLELKLALNREMFHSQVFFPVIGEALVERSVFILGDLFWLSQPNWFLLVDELPLMRHLLDLLELPFWYNNCGESLSDFCNN